MSLAIVHHAGRQIENMDHEINVLQHEAWALVNRLQELYHKEDIAHKRQESPSLFRGSESSPPTRPSSKSALSEIVCASCGSVSLLTKDDVRREYEKKHDELRARIQEVSRLRANLKALHELDKNFVSLPELVRLLTASEYQCAELLCAGTLTARPGAQAHATFKDFCADDTEHVRARLVYPQALYGRISEFARRNNPILKSIGEQEFKDAYHEYLTAA